MRKKPLDSGFLAFAFYLLTYFKAEIISEILKDLRHVVYMFRAPKIICSGISNLGTKVLNDSVFLKKLL